MKKGWELKRLDEVCAVERGSSPRPIKEYQTQSDDGVNWIKIGDTKGVEKYIYSTKEKITKEGAKQSRFVKEGDFILTNSMSFGNPYIMKTEGYIHDGWFVLRLKNYIDTEYFWYLLVSPLVQEQFNTLANGAIVKNISGDLVKKVVLPIPPLPEQQRIVSVLDEAFASIAQAKSNAERNLVNAQELFESSLDNIFQHHSKGLTQKPLVDFCEDSRVITYGVIKLGNETEDGVPCLRTSNVRWLRIETDGMKRILPSLSEQYSRTILKGGEVLVNVRGTLGGVAVVPLEMAGWNVSREVAVVPIDNKKVDPKFISYYIASGISQKWFGGVKKGAAYVGINIEDLRLLPISIPPLAEQRAIVGRLEALSAETGRLEEIYQQKVESLEELKKSVLGKEFEGEL